MICPICKKEIEDNLSECPICGTPLAKNGDHYETGKINPSVKLSYSDSNEKNLYEKNNSIAGFAFIFSVFFAVGSIFMISFTSTIYYSFLTLVPAIGLSGLAFFKAKSTHFKAVERGSLVVSILSFVLIFLAFIFVLLKLLGMMFIK